MKKIVSFHPVYACHKDFFSRDFGQIGFTFLTKKGYSSETWSLKKKGWSSFSHEGQYRHGFKYKFFMFFRLLFLARTIDFLHMYHIYKPSFFGALIYRISNWSGNIYIKMDTPLYFKKNDYRKIFSNKPKIFLVLFFKLISFIGFEDKLLLSFFKDNFPKYSHKFVLTTSGGVIVDSFVNNIKKTNSISLCGRFGSPEKNYEMFLSMLQNQNISFLDGWDFYFIGSATKDFELRINNLIKINPLLKGRIHLTGFLTDKKEVYKFMSKSKIFLHTSTREGDPNIQYDAMFCGCFLVSTDVANMKQNYPENVSLFYKIKDEVGLYTKLKEGVTVVNKFDTKKFVNIQKYFLEYFAWKKVLNPILKKC